MLHVNGVMHRKTDAVYHPQNRLLERKTGMNDNKIAFIICTNNQLYFNECCYYINRLPLPEGFERDVIGIEDAPSMCAGYNAGMQSSDAKYKVYLHHDVFIKEPKFIFYLLERFRSAPDVGMIGMVGGCGLSS